VSVAVFAAPSYVTVAVTGPAGPLSVNELAVTLAGSTALENVAVTLAERATPVAPLAGACAATAGGAGSPAGVTDGSTK
jgi:hypothetical protein